MKKQYIIPQTEIVELKYSGMLAVSGTLGGEATGPAMGRGFDDSDFEQLLNM